MPNVTVNTTVENNIVEFSVATPGKGVSVDSTFPSRLLVAPGEYAITLALENGAQFQNPALVITTPMGNVAIAPSSDLKSCTMTDANSLILGQGAQRFTFTLFTNEGIAAMQDPTIINNPPTGGDT